MNWRFLFILVPVGLLPLMYSSWFNDPVLLPKFTVFAMFLFLFALVFMLRAFRGKVVPTAGIFHYPLPLIYGIYCLYVFISATYSPNPVDGFYVAMNTSLLFVFLLFLSGWIHEPEELIRHYTKSILVLSTLIIALGVYQFVVIRLSAGYSFRNSYLMTATFAHRNLYAQVILFTMPALLYLRLKEKGFVQGLAGVLLLISGCFVVILFVRSVWIALLVGSLVTSICYLWMERIPVKRLFVFNGGVRKNYPVFLVLVVLIGTLGYGLKSIEADRYLRDQVRSMGHFHYGSVADRLHLWKKSLGMSKEDPVFGSGAGSWKINFLKTGTEGLKSTDTLTFYQRPHNDFVWVLCEQGVLGLLLYLGLFVVLFRWLISLIRHEEASQHKLFNYLLLGVLIAYVCIASFSFPKERYTHSILLTALMALVTVQYIHYFPRQIRTGVFWKAGLSLSVVFLGLVSFFLVKRSQAEMEFKPALELKRQQNWPALANQLKKVDRRYYNMDYTSTPVQWYAGMASFNLKDLPSALTAFREAEALNPYHIHVLNNLGNVYYQGGEMELAAHCFRRALSIHRNFKEANLNMAVLSYNAGGVDSAIYFMQQIDTACIDPVYHRYLDVMLHEKLQGMMDTLSDNYALHIINGMYYDWPWLKSTFQKSAVRQISLEEMLEIDVAYMRSHGL